LALWLMILHLISTLEPEARSDPDSLPGRRVSSPSTQTALW